MSSCPAPCNKPVAYYALSACGPDLWNDTAAASLGGFCSFEHAQAEPRPTLRQARRVYRNVVDMTHPRDPVRTLWKRLIAAYPDPVPVDTPPTLWANQTPESRREFERRVLSDNHGKDLRL
jgi:hypothetical protein